MNNKNRDSLLDIAKGLAIILVVTGHVIQGTAKNFDDLISFRVIYSFHMPLFVFLSGAVAGIIFKPSRVQNRFREIFCSAKKRLAKATIRLLLPFIAWCVANELIYHSRDGVISALAFAFKQPDAALWFLLAIFYCVLLMTIFEFIFAAIFYIFQKLDCQSCSAWIADGRIQLLLMIVIWWAIREHTPRGIGIGLLRPYFIYYLMGIGFYRYIYAKVNYWKYIFALIIFIILVPFWSRTAPFNLLDSSYLSLKPFLIYFYSSIVATTGSLFIIGLAKFLSLMKENVFKSFLILCGQLSLGVYAIHYFFLAYSPKVLAPLLLSVALAYLMNQIPIARTLLLGER